MTCIQFSFVPVVYFFYPETSNISLEDIDRIFLKDGDDSSQRSSDENDPEQQRAEYGVKDGLEEREYVEKV